MNWEPLYHALCWLVRANDKRAQKGREKNRRWAAKPGNREKALERVRLRRATPEYRERRRRYLATPEGREKQRQAYRRRYATPKYREKARARFRAIYYKTKNQKQKEDLHVITKHIG